MKKAVFISFISMAMAALQVFLLFIVSNVVASQQIITTLPGFDGDLPFKLETGYIGLGDLNDVQLFYYFIESERSPKDPLVLWLLGGPGCSGFSSLVYQVGPLSFDYQNSSENLPKFLLNEYSWTKVANIIFLDAPVGSGFSYANSWQGLDRINDTFSAAQTYIFLRKWLIAHPSFLLNSLYIAGDSYSGKVVPIVVQEISDGIDVGDKPRMNLKGYLLGNPVTDIYSDFNSRPYFAYMKGLITHEIYESAKRNCKGDYVNVDPSNGSCKADLQNITACIGKICLYNIYEPSCSLDILSRPLQLNWDRSIIEEDSFDFLHLPTQSSASRPWCRKDNYFYSINWANDKTVQKALGIRKGTVEFWTRCNKSLSYTKDIPSSVVDYHRNHTKKSYQVLIYSGDVDMVVPYMATEAWIKSLNLTIETGWQPWFVGGQVAGYWYRYKGSNNYHLTYATVKGAGHTGPEYKPSECLAMFDRWLSYYPL